MAAPQHPPAAEAPLTAEAWRKIDREIAKYPPEHRQSAVMAALIIAQDERAWLSEATMEEVAQYLGMAPVAVREVATFYNMYNLAPTGRYKITICTCLPCGLQGSLAAADHLKARLGIDFNETSSDGRFTLKEGECMGACAMAPVVLVNNKKMHDTMSNEKLDRLIDELGKA
jgi:NADH-quinone oxidoreductase subunit E